MNRTNSTIIELWRNCVIHLIQTISWIRLWKNTKGQDLIEYALMAGFVAVAAGAIMPGVATSISTIFSEVASAMTAAAQES
jgi:pilus assembly protein Flp/PilA